MTASFQPLFITNLIESPFREDYYTRPLINRAKISIRDSAHDEGCAARRRVVALKHSHRKGYK